MRDTKRKRVVKKQRRIKSSRQSGRGFEPHSQRCSKHQYVVQSNTTNSQGDVVIKWRCTKCGHIKVDRYSKLLLDILSYNSS